MKRGPKPADSRNGDTDGHKSDLVKKTFLFNKNVSMHLAVAALATGVEQADIVRDATETRLTDMGCDLTRPPQLPDIRIVSSSVKRNMRR
jgi:hypothetical protein